MTDDEFQTTRRAMIGAGVAGTAIFAAGTGAAQDAMVTPVESSPMDPFSTRLTPETCCAVLVDYLDGFLPGIRTADPEAYEASVQGFLRTAKLFDLPTIVLGDEGGFRGDFFPFVRELFPEGQYTYAGRTTPSAMRSGDLAEWLAEQGRSRVVIGGISIDNCTALTSLDMLAAGYVPHVVVDASGTESSLVEQAAMNRLSQAGAVMTNWVQLGSELLTSWESPEGPELGKLYSTYSRWGALGVPEAT